MKPTSVVFLFFLTLGNSFAYAQEMRPMENASEFVARIKEQSIQTQSIISDFIEEKQASYLKEPHKSVGVFYYKKSNKLRWEKKAPLKYVFITDGEKIKIQENGKEINIPSANQMIGKIKELMLALVNGDFTSGKIFTPTYSQSTENYIVKLIPQNKKLGDVYDFILATFSKKTLLLVGLTFNEKSGDKNTMTFYNSKTNQFIEDTVFTNF